MTIPSLGQSDNKRDALTAHAAICAAYAAAAGITSDELVLAPLRAMCEAARSDALRGLGLEQSLTEPALPLITAASPPDFPAPETAKKAVQQPVGASEPDFPAPESQAAPEPKQVDPRDEATAIIRTLAAAGLKDEVVACLAVVNAARLAEVPDFALNALLEALRESLYDAEAAGQLNG